eukprot:GHVL01035574.1.p1 GENE.GHVL01035574.1~~GHVL01035574.1.p1  ORF type:complete len:118 (-),score=15.19 GHVL01035574.1:3-356(-)
MMPAVCNSPPTDFFSTTDPSFPYESPPTPSLCVSDNKLRINTEISHEGPLGHTSMQKGPKIEEVSGNIPCHNAPADTSLIQPLKNYTKAFNLAPYPDKTCTITEEHLDSYIKLYIIY